MSRVAEIIHRERTPFVVGVMWSRAFCEHLFRDNLGVDASHLDKDRPPRKRKSDKSAEDSAL
jgi:hypothetical protein